MDKFNSIFKPVPPTTDYEELAKYVEAQTAAQAAVLGQAPVYITNSGGGGGGGLSSGTIRNDAWLSNTYTQMSDVGMIQMRLVGSKSKYNYGEPKPFDYIATHRLNDQKIAVFVCNGADYCVLEDNVDLFPSDALITQLRMIQK
jgi:hypothetical protein